MSYQIQMDIRSNIIIFRWYKSVEGDQLYPVSNTKHTKVHEQILHLNLVEGASSASYICQVR